MMPLLEGGVLVVEVQGGGGQESERTFLVSRVPVDVQLDSFKVPGSFDATLVSCNSYSCGVN
jgi:hypothetical protein